MKLFDAHCHLQDSRVLSKAPQLISTTQDVGVDYFAVNGITEKDWHSVKDMGATYPSVIPCFGLHPWFISGRSSNWFESLKEYFDATPSAAVGEIGLDKGPLATQSNFSEQVEVCRKQLELVKELNKPVSVHCVQAFDDLLHLMRSIGPFPAGVILHSYIGSAEMVPEFYKLGTYFSFSGHLQFLKPDDAKEMLKTDFIGDRCARWTIENKRRFCVFGSRRSCSPTRDRGKTTPPSKTPLSIDASTLPEGTLNHPANILNVLGYVASMLEIPEEELAELSYQNAVRVFSYEGSKLIQTSTQSC